ncbi:MAG: MGH1-like glycoside hydrolase domain-containing protein [Leadbetterella sp.]
MKKNKIRLLFTLTLLLFFLQIHAQTPAQQYAIMQNNMQKGWGTFNHRSVLSHVLLPEAIALNIGFKTKAVSFTVDNYLKNAVISSRADRPEKVKPGFHALDNSYTELELQWNGIVCKVESAVNESNDIFLLVTPTTIPEDIPSVVLETGFLWNKKGIISAYGNQMSIKGEKKQIIVNTIGDITDEFLANTSPYLAVKLNKQVAFYTGKSRSIEQIKTLLAKKRNALIEQSKQYKNLAATFNAINNVLGWNIIYDASKKRVIYPVSRLWNDNFGGEFILFDWDTYFGAYMASMTNKSLAYANAVEITKSITPSGFIPNFAGSYGTASFDRSQPPVGSYVCKEIYRKYKEKWFLELVFDDLVKWNRWWINNREDKGYLCWGSNKVLPPYKSDIATNTFQGAAYESGLDNSPMFDNVPFNKDKNMMAQADVGLMSFYVMDCESLADIALILNKEAIAIELKERAVKYRNKLNTLWHQEDGMYYNKRIDTDEFNKRVSPTNFYPLLAKAATQEQAITMIEKHLLNPDEFNTEWIFPSISKNDPAYKDQEYWRGRIWAPMNFLVYLGMLNYDMPEARKIVSEKSNKLMMDNLNINGWIFENYNGITGNVSDQEEGRKYGDNYYHWGALLGFIALIENNFVENPTKTIK